MVVALSILANGMVKKFNTVPIFAWFVQSDTQRIIVLSFFADVSTSHFKLNTKVIKNDVPTALTVDHSHFFGEIL